MIHHALVTGGTGVTGNALVRYLLNQNIRVMALMRPGSFRRKYLPEGHPLLSIIECGMDNYRQMPKEQILSQGESLDVFFHFAWDGSTGKQKVDNRNNFYLQNQNVTYALDAVELCHQLACPVFVMTGSQAEYGRRGMPISEIEEMHPENGYGMAKLCAEGMTRQLCRKYGIRHIWPILFSVYGPNDATESLIDTSVRGLLRGETLPYTWGEQMWDYLYSYDAAKALLLLAEKGRNGESYNVASGRVRPLKEYIHEMYRVLAPDLTPRLGEVQYGENPVMYLGASIEKLHRETGFVPEYDFAQGIREIADAVRKETLGSCRSCGALLPEENLVAFNNMPSGAQSFPDKESLSQDAGVDIVLKECPCCGLVQVTGEPVPYFRDVIRATSVSEEMRNFRLQQYKDWVKLHDLWGKRVIEIGCGRGEYMDMMEQSGALVFGVEHKPESVQEGRRAGHQIFEGFLEKEQTRIEGAPYDGFYCMNFLEHIPAPGVFLRSIAKNLSRGAYGLVEVPDFGMMLEKSLYSELIQDHLSYFTPQTLENVLRQNGFDVLSMKTIWYGYILSAEVQKRKTIDINGFSRKREDLKRQMADFLDQQHKQGKKVAVWGAGHQALANLSLLDMGEKIECVIDSAAFKQGKYTPATHLPILSPQRLREGDIGMVIIMAAGYSHEVKAIIERDYPEVESVILMENGIQP